MLGFLCSVRAWYVVVGILLSQSLSFSSSAPLAYGQEYDADDRFLPSRRLLQRAGPRAEAAASVTVVTTARQLQAAAQSRAQDIEVRSHLDLSALPLATAINGSYNPTAIGAIIATRSIRGNCTSPPPAIASFGLSGPDFQWQSPQCVLVCDHDVLYVWSNTWLDALYIRAKPSLFFLWFGLAVGENATVYGSRLTLQGDGNWNTSGVVSRGQVYVQDSLFLDCGGATQLVGAFNGSIVFNRTTFTNVVQRRSPHDFQPQAAGGPDAGQYLANGLFSATGDSASILVQDCEFDNVTVDNMFWVGKGGYIAGGGNTGAPEVVYDLEERADVPLNRLGPVPQEFLQPLRQDDEWWLTVRKRLSEANASSYTPEADPPALVQPPPPVNGTDPPQIAAVYTVEDFQRAFHAGIRDIELRDHMDLRRAVMATTLFQGFQMSAPLGGVRKATRSIRGNCTSAPPPELDPWAVSKAASPEPWAAPRCALLVRHRTFLLDDAHLWVDSLHIQVDNSTDDFQFVFWASWSSALFLTNSVVQGDGREGTVALEVQGSRLGAYIRGTVFDSVTGIDPDTFPSAIKAYFSPIFFESCTFRALAVPSRGSPLEAGEHVYGAIHAHGLNASLAFQNCSFADIRSEHLISARGGSAVYSDNPAQTGVWSYLRDPFAPQPLTTVVSRTQRQGPFLTTTDPWFTALQETLAAPPPSAYLRTFPIPGAAQPPSAPPPRAPPPEPSTGIALGPGAPLFEAEPSFSSDGEGTATGTDDDFVEVEVDGDDSSGGMGAGAIIGIVAAAVVAVVALLTLLLIGVRVKKRRLGDGGAPPAATAAPPTIGTAAAARGDELFLPVPAQMGFASNGPRLRPPDYVKGPHGYPQHGPHAYAAAAQPPSSGGGSSAASAAAPRPQPSLTARTASTNVTAFTRSTWSDYQKAAGGAATPLDQLEVALDAMCGMQAPFYGRYLILSAIERRPGGQGVVQFASISGAGASQDQAAIKFYLHREAFRRERELYTESQLTAMMPATLAVEENAAGEHRTPYGYVFPPFVIIERGQSLDEWAKDNSDSDFVTIYQALSHTVRALAKLHSFGYAHRDIKPGNILRRPKQHDWTLIDFGCAAKIGSTASLSFSMKYAAPEVIHALEAGARTIISDAAVDIWAIGVIAFELFTGERAFPVFGVGAAESEAAAQEAIAGRVPLPWEGSSEATSERLGKLRVMRRTVLQCLQRDPVKRPTAEALLRSWDHTFDSMHTRGTDWSASAASG